MRRRFWLSAASYWGPAQLFGVEAKKRERAGCGVLEAAEVRAEAVISRLAGRQHGVVSSAQLVAAGWSKDQIARRARVGWLRAVHRGVYLVGPLETEHTRAMAAVLACGRLAVISHHPAGVLWELWPPRDGEMHVT